MGHDEPAYDANNPIIRGGQPVVENEYLTDAFTREAVDLIDRQGDDPFFLYLAYNAVHSPLQGADKYMQRFAHIEDLHRRIFAAMLANLDDSVGAVLDKVRDKQLEERTIIFFLSDNGGPTRELTSSNLPLRGEKGQMYEGGLRVPFMVQWQGKVPAGRVFDKPIVSVDIFATAARLSGAKMPSNLDGVDLMPYLTGQQSGRPHETFYWRQGSKTALRHGDCKLVNMQRDRSPPKWELYNIANDISEQDNLATEMPAKVAELKMIWQKQNDEMIESAF
jgi:arylsulfatase B